MLALGCAALLACTGERTRELRIGATTTLEDSGMLGALIAAYRAEVPEARLRVIVGGTGEVLALGARGDVDLTVTHDPEAEAAFVAAGHGGEPVRFMESDFVIAGPISDPAGAGASADALAALTRLAGRAAFVSRGDDSGTHRRERALWRAAGFEPDTFPRGPGAWYIEAGAGMGDALALAGERQAYLLADRPTWLALGSDRLRIVTSGDARLLNPYTVMVVARTPRTAAARRFAHWLTSPAAASVINGFGDADGLRPFRAARAQP